MLTRAEAERIAASGSALRPEWSVEQILAVLKDPRIRVQRAYLDVAVAVTRLACDPQTRQPTRLLEAGRWWAVDPRDHNTSAGIRHARPDDCWECGGPKDGTHIGHEYVQRYERPPVPMPDELRTQLTRRP